MLPKTLVILPMALCALLLNSCNESEKSVEVSTYEIKFNYTELLDNSISHPESWNSSARSHANGQVIFDWSKIGGRSVEVGYRKISEFGSSDLPSGAMIRVFCFDNKSLYYCTNWLSEYLPLILDASSGVEGRIVDSDILLPANEILKLINEKASSNVTYADYAVDFYGIMFQGSDAGIDMQILVKAWGTGSSMSYSVSIRIIEIPQIQRYTPVWLNSQ